MNAMLVFHLHAEGNAALNADRIVMPRDGKVVGIALSMTTAGATIVRAEVSQIPYSSLDAAAGYAVTNRQGVLAEIKVPASAAAVPTAANAYFPMNFTVYSGTTLYLNNYPDISSVTDAYVFFE